VRTSESASEAEVPLVSDGNRDGNDDSHQRADPAVDSRLLSRISPELGIRYT
jgi:hypothetical protein